MVCLDGTNNEFAAENTNVVRLFQVAVDDPEAQVRYYDPGVGTIGHPGAITRAMQKTTQVLGMAFGLGVTQNVTDAYRFLMEHHRENDRIFIFGFSRGALEARALAGLLYRCGLLKRELGTLAPYAIRLFQTVGNDAVAAEFKETFSRTVSIHFLGIWDTVTSVGNVWDPIAWPNTTRNPAIATVRHAIALDERRAFFRQNRWAEGDATANQDVQERWFIGVHSDVGGGYRADESALWTTTFAWMLREAERAGLLINRNAAEQMIAAAREARDDPHGWNSPLHDSMPGAGGLWYVAEFVPKRRWRGKTPQGEDQYEWMWPVQHWFSAWRSGGGVMGRARAIGRPRGLQARDWLHRSVLERFAATANYRPDSLLAIGLTPELASALLASGEESYNVGAIQTK